MDDIKDVEFCDVKIKTEPNDVPFEENPLESTNPIKLEKDEFFINHTDFEEITIKHEPKYEVEEITSEKFWCELCNVKFDSEISTKAHHIFHTERSTFICSTCHQICKSKKVIVNHMKKHYDIVNVSKCKLCNLTYADEQDLVEHTRTLKHVKNFSCDICLKQFYMKSNLTIHKRLHTDQSIECSICHEKFTRLLFLQNHMRKHEDRPKKNRQFKCQLCDYVSESYDDILKHKKTHTRILKCKKCEFIANDYQIMRKHKTVHLPIIDYKCELCNYETRNKQRLVEHKATHYDVKPYICHICSAQLCTKNNLTRHIRSHTKGCFECTLCKKNFNLLKYLKEHMKRHGSKNLFECESCDFKSYKKYDLDKHQIVMNHKKTYSCEECNKDFTTKHSFKLHNNIHKGEERFQCIVCDEKFILSRRLLHHMKMTHPDAKPLECDVCKYTSFVTSSFEKHKQRHKEVKPFMCAICKVGFNYNQSLKKHMTSHLGLTPYECTLCDKKYGKYDTLKIHMLSHSRNLNETTE